MRNNIWAAFGLSVAMAAFPLSPAAAQTASDGEIDHSQRMLVVLFGSGGNIANFRGEPGASGSWHMLRTVSGATVTRRCVLTLQTPDILTKSPNVTPAQDYNLDFATVRNFMVTDRNIVFIAGHMASGEAGMLGFNDSEAFANAIIHFKFMVAKCFGRN